MFLDPRWLRLRQARGRVPARSRAQAPPRYDRRIRRRGSDRPDTALPRSDRRTGRPAPLPRQGPRRRPNDRLFIADSGHDRVLITNLDGQIQQSIGSGKPGLLDGTAESAFTEPQGMALAPDGRTLYVADRANHALRAIDLGSGHVTTVAGTGEARQCPRRRSGHRDVTRLTLGPRLARRSALDRDGRYPSTLDL